MGSAHRDILETQEMEENVQVCVRDMISLMAPELFFTAHKGFRFFVLWTKGRCEIRFLAVLFQG